MGANGLVALGLKSEETHRDAVRCGGSLYRL